MVVVPWVANKFKLAMARRFKRDRSGAAQAFHRGAYSAAFLGDFFVASAGDALFVFVGAAAWENQMRVGIDEAGENHASREI